MEDPQVSWSRLITVCCWSSGHSCATIPERQSIGVSCAIMLFTKPQKPLNEWTVRELRGGVAALCAFAAVFLLALAFLARYVGVLSFPVLFCCIVVHILYVASMPMLQELRRRRSPS